MGRSGRSGRALTTRAHSPTYTWANIVESGLVMRPMLHPMLVNGRTGDPALYVETLFERRAILFDLGDITALSPRKIQRLEYAFVFPIRISITSTGSIACYGCWSGARRRSASTDRKVLRKTFITNFTPIVGIWSTAIRLISPLWSPEWRA